jgi:rare lipoprotein A
MRTTKLHYVFSFIFILSIYLSAPVYAQKKGKFQKGLATWYGAKYHGKKTTSGEVYNKNKMTAAHLTLPFGTKVKVTNPVNKKSVIVRINDRGPFGNKDRIIDLSEAAARKIQVHQNGEANVTVEILSATAWLEADKKQVLAQVPVTAPEKTGNITNLPGYIVQAGSFTDWALKLPLTLDSPYKKASHSNPAAKPQFANGTEDEELNGQLEKKGLYTFVKQLFGAS